MSHHSQETHGIRSGSNTSKQNQTMACKDGSITVEMSPATHTPSNEQDVEPTSLSQSQVMRPDNTIQTGGYQQGIRNRAPPDSGPTTCLFTILAQTIIFITFPFSFWFCFKIVREYERAVIFRLGRCISSGAQGPGLFWINPIIDHMVNVDYRTVSFDVPPQEVLTKDSTSITVDAVVYYRVTDAVMSVVNIDDYSKATMLLSASLLRNIMGNNSLSQILTEREAITDAMQKLLDEATDPWGIKVERVEIKDVRLPATMQRSMAAEAEATRGAKAKIIEAQGEMDASVALREASEIMMRSPAAIQLRYLQTITTVSAERNQTIIFPVPQNLMSKFG